MKIYYQLSLHKYFHIDDNNVSPVTGESWSACTEILVFRVTRAQAATTTVQTEAPTSATTTVTLTATTSLSCTTPKTTTHSLPLSPTLSTNGRFAELVSL